MTKTYKKYNFVAFKNAYGAAIGRTNDLPAMPQEAREFVDIMTVKDCWTRAAIEVGRGYYMAMALGPVGELIAVCAPSLLHGSLFSIDSPNLLRDILFSIGDLALFGVSTITGLYGILGSYHIDMSVHPQSYIDAELNPGAAESKATYNRAVRRANALIAGHKSSKLTND